MTEHTQNEIESEKIRLGKNQLMLDILQRQGISALPSFLTALRGPIGGYGFLADELSLDYKRKLKKKGFEDTSLQGDSHETLELKYEQSVLLRSSVRKIPNKMVHYQYSFQCAYNICSVIVLIAAVFCNIHIFYIRNNVKIIIDSFCVHMFI